MKAQQQHARKVARKRWPTATHVVAFHPGGHVVARCVHCGGDVRSLDQLRERCPARETGAA